MQTNILLLDYVADAYARECRTSAGALRMGNPSTEIILLGRIAGTLRRYCEALEDWAVRGRLAELERVTSARQGEHA
jgi:hypothetical protein